MNELVESIVNFIIVVIAPVVFGGYIVIKVFSAISGWFTEEKDDVLEQLEASGAYYFAQRLLNTSPGATLIGTVSGIKVHVTIFLTNIVEDVTDSMFTWIESTSEDTVKMVGDGKGEVEVRPRYTEGQIKFLVGTSNEDMQLVRDHLTRALIIVREEWARNPPEKPDGEGQVPHSSSAPISPAHE